MNKRMGSWIVALALGVASIAGAQAITARSGASAGGATGHSAQAGASDDAHTHHARDAPDPARHACDTPVHVDAVSVTRGS